MFWIGILYFAEGFPLGVFYDVFPVHFRQQGVDLREIGFLSLLGLAWTLKFLCGPRQLITFATIGAGCSVLIC